VNAPDLARIPYPIAVTVGLRRVVYERTVINTVSPTIVVIIGITCITKSIPIDVALGRIIDQWAVIADVSNTVRICLGLMR
jgi:hypothetical protein